MKNSAVITAMVLILTTTIFAKRDYDLAPGTAIPVALDQGITTQTPAGTVFSGVVSMDVLFDNKIALPSGTKVQGRVMSSQSARRVAGQAQLTIVIDKILVEDEYYSVAVQPVEFSSDGNARSTVAKTGVAAGVGAAFGGGRGAARGAAVGGAVALASNSTDGSVPAGSVVQFQLAETFTVKR